MAEVKLEEFANTVADAALDCEYEGKTIREWVQDITEADYVGKWIPVSERLPENANHLGALCPRYRISSAKYGVTEGWYNPDMGTWYGLVWQLTPGNIEVKRGDIPVVIRMIDVIAWMPSPKPYKVESGGT